MRNIEEIAAEEEARSREIQKGRLQKLLLLLGVGLGLWGWRLFASGQMGSGALAIVLSLCFFALAWGGRGIFQLSFSSFGLGLLAALPVFGLYALTRSPSFSWGKDPSFWLSVHGGALAEPFWSPLSYLLDQALCFLFPQKQFLLLPFVSGTVFSVGFFFIAQNFFLQFKNGNFASAALGILICWSLGVSLPFWGAGTLGSGLTASLGLLLFLFQRSLLEKEEKPWKVAALLTGLLGSIHPLWGILGLIRYLQTEEEGTKWKGILLPFVMGLTPYLWVFFRAGHFFPSWGGLHPWMEILRQWKSLWGAHWAGDWSFREALAEMGWIPAFLGLIAVLLWFLNFFKWKAGSKRPIQEAGDFWIWVLSGVGALLFFSSSSGTLGPVAPWFVLGLGEMILKLSERGGEKRHTAFFSGPRLVACVAGAVFLGLGLAGLPRQQCFRSQSFFPLQHSLNLLKTLGAKSLFIAEDPFEAAACREARFVDPVALSAVVLEKKYLNQRWYITQAIDHQPELLFSNVTGSIETILGNIVMDNRDRWEIHWGLSALPAGWKGAKAFPTVLTQVFEGEGAARADSEKIQYRYDLTALPLTPTEGEIRSGGYLTRYVSGFNELGKSLMASGHYSAAIHAFERAVKLDPSFAEPQACLSKMYSQQNIIEAAKLEFEKILKTHPGKIGERMKGLEDAQGAGDEVKTVMLLDEMVRLNAELADAQYQLSKIYEKLGRTRESKAMLESSVKLNPQQVEAQMTLGRLMAKMGNRIKAEEAFRAVLLINPENKEAQIEYWKLLNKP
jgi:tetratricopeptide (TPR) repeat protein